MKRRTYLFLTCWIVALIVSTLAQRISQQNSFYSQESEKSPPDSFIAVNSWIPDGNPICVLQGHHESERIISDGAGGAIITWQDRRNLVYFDIYAQRVDSSGTIQWTVNGAAICTASYDQGHPKLCSDGGQGAIITWHDRRSSTHYDIYAQKISASGVVQWTGNGVPICTLPYDQDEPTICSDGAGGAIIAWRDYRSGSDLDIYMQHINASGYTQWTTNGIVICNGSQGNNWNGGYYENTMCADGAGGAIIAWQDNRNGTYQVYAQRVDSTGHIQWVPNGVPLILSNYSCSYHQVCSDDAGGAFVCMQDSKIPANIRIYMQHINATGDILWGANGNVLCNASGSQDFSALIRNPFGDLIICWRDSRSGNYDVYAQKLNNEGECQWGANGTAICTANGAQDYNSMCSDGVGGAIFIWSDHRGADYDIYIQRINSDGIIQWTNNGVAVCTASADQTVPLLCSQYCYAILTWSDFRTQATTLSDIYCGISDMTSPTNFSIIHPTGWINDRTPSIICRLCENSSGINVSSARYAYSKTGESAPTNWTIANVFKDEACSVPASNGDIGWFYIEAPEVPFNQDSSSLNTIRFSVKDLVGYLGLQASASVIKIDSQGPDSFSINSPTDWVTQPTPTVVCQFYAAISGINVTSVDYAYSNLGDNMPTNWALVDGVYNDPACSDPAVNGDTGWLYARVLAVPFNQDSATLNKIRFKSSDLAANEVIQNTTNIKIDSSISKPGNLKASPPTWTTSNAFNISWSNPADLSGIIGAYYKLDALPTSNTDGIFVGGNNISEINGIELEGYGRHILYVWLIDSAGNIFYLKYDSTYLYWKEPGSNSDFAIYLLLFILIASVGAVGTVWYYKYHSTPPRQKTKSKSKLSTESGKWDFSEREYTTSIDNKLQYLIENGIPIDSIFKIRDAQLNEYFAQDFDLISPEIIKELRNLGIPEVDLKTILEEFNLLPKEKRRKFLLNNLFE